MKQVAVLLGVCASLAACGSKNTPTAPVVPARAACETQNTAAVSFENRSNISATYDIVWDGTQILTLTPGQKSESRTVAAGVQHTLTFRYTNSGGRLACATSTPTLAMCQSMTYWCTY